MFPAVPRKQNGSRQISVAASTNQRYTRLEFSIAMTEHTLAAEIVRLQKLDLDDDHLRGSIEEAAELLAEGRYMEAEALVQNADARVRYAGRRAAGSIGL